MTSDEFPWCSCGIKKANQSAPYKDGVIDRNARQSRMPPTPFYCIIKPYLNLQWQITTIAVLYIHNYIYRTSKRCSTIETSSVAQNVFTLSVSCVLLHGVWPKTFCKPPLPFLILFEICATMCIHHLVKEFFWELLENILIYYFGDFSFGDLIVDFCEKIGFGINQALSIRDLIGEQSGWSLLTAFGLFFWSLHANGTLTSLFGSRKSKGNYYYNNSFNRNEII